MATVIRSVVRLLAGVSVGSFLISFPKAAGQEKDVKVIAFVADFQGNHLPKIGGDKGNMKDGRGQAVVARKRADLGQTPEAQKQAEARLLELLKVKAIDWDTQMVVRIDAGSSRYDRQVRVTSLTAKGKSLTVHWLAEQMGVGGLQAAGIALVPRFDGEVTFVGK